MVYLLYICLQWTRPTCHFLLFIHIHCIYRYTYIYIYIYIDYILILWHCDNRMVWNVLVVCWSPSQWSQWCSGDWDHGLIRETFLKVWRCLPHQSFCTKARRFCSMEVWQTVLLSGSFKSFLFSPLFEKRITYRWRILFQWAWNHS